MFQYHNAIILVHMKFVYMFMVCLITKFHVSSSSGSLVIAIKPKTKYRFCGSHSGDNEEYYLLRCEATWSAKSVPMFRRNVLPPSSWLNSKQAAACLLALLLDSVDGGSTFLLNICKLLSDYTALHLTR
jgi:hypothetical protein